MSKRRPPAALTVIDEPGMGAQGGQTMLTTGGGSLMLRDFRLNALGGLTGIPMGDLVLGQELGRGASSVVYIATYKPQSSENLHLQDMQVAVKCLNNLHDKELRKQLMAELAFLRPKLRAEPAPHAVHLFDAYHHDDRTYVVMEFCERGALDSCIKRSGPPPEPALSVIMRHIFLGLCYLHRNAIIHRDMKPGNCLVTAEGVVKVSDFGSSKQADAASGGMATTFTGTLRYMSPERLDGEAYSAAADIWCAGMIMMEAAYGHHPYALFGEDGSFMAMREYARERPTPPMAPAYSAGAGSLAHLCLAKSASDRPAASSVVNEAAPAASHPFIVAHLAADHAVVAAWADSTR